MRVPASKKSRREVPRRSIHIKRVTAEIRTVNAANGEGKPSIEASARILLNDLSIKGVGVFANKPFQAGQEIAILLTEPTQIYLRGKIIYCNDADSRSQIIAAEPYSFRIGIKFVFADATEEANVRKFCEDLFKSLHG